MFYWKIDKKRPLTWTGCGTLTGTGYGVGTGTWCGTGTYFRLKIDLIFFSYNL
jgi:hypothetical protein